MPTAPKLKRMLPKPEASLGYVRPLLRLNCSEGETYVTWLSAILPWLFQPHSSTGIFPCLSLMQIEREKKTFQVIKAPLNLYKGSTFVSSDQQGVGMWFESRPFAQFCCVRLSHCNYVRETWGSLLHHQAGAMWRVICNNMATKEPVRLGILL